jgi:hypothetical protein
MVRGGVVVAMLALAVNCGGRSVGGGSLDGDARVDDGDARTDAGDACVADGDPFAATNTPGHLCRVDSDCHNSYLACRSRYVGFCQSPEVPLSRCQATLLGLPAEVPSCPTTIAIDLQLCQVRHQLPCRVATDCGPAGFECVVTGSCPSATEACGTCQGGNEQCATADECPTGWECYASCPCANRVGTKRCYPPHALFRCPLCAPIVDVDGGTSD